MRESLHPGCESHCSLQSWCWIWRGLPWGCILPVCVIRSPFNRVQLKLGQMAATASATQSSQGSLLGLRKCTGTVQRWHGTGKGGHLGTNASSAICYLCDGFFSLASTYQSIKCETLPHGIIISCGDEIIMGLAGCLAHSLGYNYFYFYCLY